MDLATELQKVYDSEVNVEIGWFWTAANGTAWGQDERL
jgi:hypothetical protein